MREGTDTARRSLVGASLAHALHDGYTDLLYVLLPVWQTEFGLGYAGLAAIRCLYYGTMGGLQIPADRLASGFRIRTALVVSTLIAAAGFVVMALTGSFAGLCAGLILAGIGASLQHPRASLLVSRAFGGRARGPLGIYNFAGDLGKAAFPILVALLLAFLTWRAISGVMALIGLATALALLPILRGRDPIAGTAKAQRTGSARDPTGFRLLLAIGALDTATRMGYLLFLPFLLQIRGGETLVGLGLALVFAGGALGKAACGWLGARFGVVACVVTTEAATAALILLTLVLPLWAILVVLPILGVVLNGTSSVLYGTVPELAPSRDTGQAFAWFYTSVIGSGGLAPIGFGLLADGTSQAVGIAAAALTAIATVPLVVALRSPLHESQTSEQA